MVAGVSDRIRFRILSPLVGSLTFSDQVVYQHLCNPTTPRNIMFVRCDPPHNLASFSWCIGSGMNKA